MRHPLDQAATRAAALFLSPERLCRKRCQARKSRWPEAAAYITASPTTRRPQVRPPRFGASAGAATQSS
eukprot:13930587-Alexandrium_andersonii.AAC.1